MKFKNFYNLKRFVILIVILCIELAFFNNQFAAQEIEVKIKPVAVSPARVSIAGKFLRPASSFKDWSFLQNYADVTNLGERIENLQFFDEKGGTIEVKKLAAGEYQASQNPVSWTYDVKNGMPNKITDAAHVSWMSAAQGLLMLEDLLPQFKNKLPAKITFDLPDDWEISSSETFLGQNSFKVDEISKAVFLIGRNWREKKITAGKITLNLVLTGDWQFTDDEALEMVSSIFQEHRKVFGELPISKAQILLLPFPQSSADADRWRAETRGTTVVIVSGMIPFKSAAIQRLHEQLRHEIFHLWIPNALSLSGNYDWFYEGFTIYQALRTGVELNQIRFEDYLNTLGRGYDLADWRDSEIKENLSLIESSKQRWTGSGNYVYAKGLVVAFLCDLIMLRESNGKRNLKDIFRTLYQKSRRPNEIQDGNTVILNILKNYPELQTIVGKYIEGNSKIDWLSDLESAGIDFDGRKLSIKTKLDGRQKDLLDKLGYNQWRKLLDKKK